MNKIVLFLRKKLYINVNVLIFLASIICLLLISCSNLTSRYALGVKKPKIKTISTHPQIVPNIEMHTDTIRKIAIDNDEKYIVTGSFDKTIRVWKYKKKRYECDLHKILRVPVGEGSEGKIYAVAISPNGKTIAAAGWTGLSWQHTSNIYLFNTDTGQLIHRISGLPNVVHDLSFSHLGTRLVASLGGKNGIYIYDTIYYNLVHRDRYYEGAVYASDFNALERLATISTDGYLRLYDQDFLLIAKVKTKGGSIPHSLDFSPDNLLIAVGFADTTNVDIYSDKTLDFQYSPDVKNLYGKLKNVCWGKDGSLYISGKNVEKKRTIRRFPPNNSPIDIVIQTNGEIQHLVGVVNGDLLFCSTRPSFGVIAGNQLRLHKKANTLNYRNDKKVFSLSPDGVFIHFTYNDSENAYFSFQDAQAQLYLSKPKNAGRYVAFLPAITTSNEVKISNWKNSRQMQINGKEITLDSIIRSIAIAPKKKAIILGTDHYLYFLDSNNNVLWKKKIESSAWNVNIARNEKVFAVAFGNGMISWFDLNNGEKLFTFFTVRNNNKDDKKRWIAWKNNEYVASEKGKSLVCEIRNKSTETIAGQQPLLAVNNMSSNSSKKDSAMVIKINPAVTSNVKKQNLYVLSVGISKYKESKLNLDFAAKDAQDFYKKMNTQYHYNKIFGREVVNENATQIEILRGLDFIQENCTKDDIAIIFLAGHGEKDDFGDYYFLPTDFYPKRGISKTAIEFKEIQNVINNVSGKVVLLLDTCHSGAVNMNKLVADFASNKNQLVVMSSAAGNQVAFEGNDWNNGAFTKSLLEGLDGKASYKGQISIQQLHTYISNRVKELTGNKQTPTIMIPNSISDFVIAISK